MGFNGLMIIQWDNKVFPLGDMAGEWDLRSYRDYVHLLEAISNPSQYKHVHEAYGGRSGIVHRQVFR